MFYKRPNARKGGTGALLSCMRRLACAAAIAFFFCIAVLPAYAHDDDGPTKPPTAEAQAAAARMTIAILSLVTGVAVYYIVQRHRLINSAQHPPEWEKKMNRNAILFAVVSAVAVGGISAALSRPAPKPVVEAPMMPQLDDMLKPAPAQGLGKKAESGTRHK